MPVFFDNKRLFTDDGIPYMWQSGDVTTTPSNEVKIFPSDGVSGDEFGSAVAVGCGKIVIGASGDNTNRGAVYIYDLDGSNETKITASDGVSGDEFGSAVAVGCGKIVVGSYRDNANRGAAYIYDLDGSNEIKITASDSALSDNFGKSVAVGCGKIVVGAYRKDRGSNGYQGAAYIYDLDGSNEIKITASDGAANDLFGFSVAVGSGRIVVGAYQDDDNGSSSGSAYIYNLDGSNEIKITASDGAIDDFFGTSVAVGSGRIVVGAYQDDDNGFSSGSAYIYDLDGSNEIKITASDGAADDRFGISVAVGSGRIVVGSRYHDGDNSDQGSIYIFDLDGNELDIVRASDGEVDDYFGWSVAIGSGKIVVGAISVDDGDIEQDIGAAYIYDTPLVYNLYDAIDLNYG